MEVFPENTHKLFIEKAQKYCAYQERCSYEVRKKLASWGLKAENTDRIIRILIEGDFINDDRYLKFYIAGKAGIKKWGRVKIAYHLRALGFREEAFKKMLDKHTETYQKNLNDTIDKKISLLAKEKNPQIVKQKVYRYCLSKGFENSEIITILNQKITPNGHK